MVPIHATRETSLGNITLRGKKPDTKGHPLYDFIDKEYPECKSTEAESRLVVSRGWREGGLATTA